MDRETIWPERDIVRLGHGISDWQEWVRVLTSYSLTPTRVTHSVTGNESLCQKTRCASLPERWNLSSRDRETAIGSSRIILVIAYSLPRLIIESAPTREIVMLRKFALVVVAATTLGAATLAPTSASAWYGGWRGGGWSGGWHGAWRPGWRAGWGPGWGWRRGWGWGGPAFVVGAPVFVGGCVGRRLVPGPWGPRWILVNRCW